ncbi:hypothetical protein [uncultured Paraglaciecola sp.]|uniref:hypothetical protein n=1 Tax=uncultured Paraglaciecola sp. TaxID=1765024 RepID=UPI002607E321|nr:hypothetical protein [uncultured Paraglaciecola sp.]
MAYLSLASVIKWAEKHFKKDEDKGVLDAQLIQEERTMTLAEEMLKISNQAVIKRMIELQKDCLNEIKHSADMGITKNFYKTDLVYFQDSENLKKFKDYFIHRGFKVIDGESLKTNRDELPYIYIYWGDDEGYERLLE